MENGGRGYWRNIKDTPYWQPADKRTRAHVEIGQHGTVKRTRRQAEMYWICFHPAFLATRSRVSNKEWMAQDDGITEGTKVSRTHPRFPSNPCRPGPTLPRRSNTNVGSVAPKFAQLESGKQPSDTHGHAWCPSMDNIVFTITYASIVLSLYS